MVVKTLCISADSHVVEPPEVFNGLEERFGEEAPKILHHEEYGDILSVPGQPLRPNFGVGRLGIAGHYANDPETIEMIHKGYAGMRKGVLDPVARLDDQAIDGIDAEVLYPSVLFAIYRIKNPQGRRRRVPQLQRLAGELLLLRLRAVCSRSPASRCTTSTKASPSSSAPPSWAIAAPAYRACRRKIVPTPTRSTTGSGHELRS